MQHRSSFCYAAAFPMNTALHRPAPRSVPLTWARSFLSFWLATCPPCGFRKEVYARRAVLANQAPDGTYISHSKYADEAVRISSTGRLAF